MTGITLHGLCMANSWSQESPRITPVLAKHFCEVVLAKRDIRQGIVDKVEPNFFDISERRSYSIVYSGYIEFPEAGMVRMGIGSDDGSMLHLNNQLVIDNDLAHGFQTLTRWVRIPRGLVPFRVEFIEVGGDSGLVLSASHDIEGKRPIALKVSADASGKDN